MTGRTVSKFVRVYADGYDLSGHARSIGPLIQTFENNQMAGLNWEVQGALPNKVTLGVGTLNGIFDSTATSGLHTIASGAGVSRNVMVAIGDRAVPAAGVPVYCGEFNQNDYLAESGDQMITATIPFGANTPTTGMLYDKPWGVLLHASSSATAANTGTGIESETGAATAAGGYLMYQIFSITGTGTVTISVDDSADNITFAALTDATSGAIATASAPVADIVQLGVTADVGKYLRWQIAFGASATACSFALAFVRK